MSEEHKRGISEEEAADQARKYAGKVSEETVGEMMGKEEKMKGFFRHVSVLKKYWQDVCDIFAYVLSPLDLIPDFIPGAGFLDDAGVFAAVLGFAGGD